MAKLRKKTRKPAKAKAKAKGTNPQVGAVKLPGKLSGLHTTKFRTTKSGPKPRFPSTGKINTITAHDRRP